MGLLNDIIYRLKFFFYGRKYVPKPKNCYYCQTEIGGTTRFYCSHCGQYFCPDHRNPISHQGVYAPEKSKLSIIGRCSVCGKGLTTLSKLTCLRCFGSFCMKHVRGRRHRCKQRTSGPFQMAGYEYNDGTKVYFPGRKTGPGYRYGKKK